MLEYSMFNRLPAENQVDVLLKNGTVLAQRNHKNYIITLYFLNNYFVELWTKEGIEIIGSFHKQVSTMAILEPYMDTINITEFLEN